MISFKNTFNYFLILVLFSFTISCKEYALVKEDKSVPEFSKVTSYIPGNYILKAGSESSIRIASERDDLEKITYEVVDGELIIGEYVYGATVVNGGEVRIIITSPVFNKIYLREEIDMTVEGILETEKLEIIVEEDADIKLDNIKVKDLDLQLLFPGTITISDGMVENGKLLINRNGSGIIKTFGVTYENCEVEIDKSLYAIVEVSVNNELNASITGRENEEARGLVYYKGDPKITVLGDSGDRVIKEQ